MLKVTKFPVCVCVCACVCVCISGCDSVALFSALQRRKQLAHLSEALQQEQRQLQEEEGEEHTDRGGVVHAGGRKRLVRHQSNSAVCTIL